MALNNVAAYVADQGRYAESLELSQEALAIQLALVAQEPQAKAD